MSAEPDYAPGDPAVRVLGRPEEQAARRHAPQPPKPILGLRAIKALVRARLDELEPLAAEHAELERIHERLKPILRRDET